MSSAHAEHPVTPVSTYLKVFAALMVLTVTTVGIAEIDLGILNTFVAVTIGVIKASIVAWFFMHLRHSSKITWVVAIAGVVGATVVPCASTEPNPARARIRTRVSRVSFFMRFLQVA